MEVTWTNCREVEREHKQDQRQYAHTFHYPGMICLAKAFWDLPKPYRDGILFHEAGHLLAGSRASENAATKAAEDYFGITIEYLDSPYGRKLERRMNTRGCGTWRCAW